MTSVTGRRSPHHSPAAGTSPGGPRFERRRHIPLWRRLTAAFTLGSMVVVGGLVLAGLIAMTILLMLFALERAIAG